MSIIYKYYINFVNNSYKLTSKTVNNFNWLTKKDLLYYIYCFEYKEKRKQKEVDRNELIALIKQIATLK